MKQTKKLFSLLAVTAFFACNNKQEVAKNGNPRYSDEIEKRIANVMNNLQVATEVNDVFRSDNVNNRLAYYHTPGISVAVINEGKIEWARGFGLKNETDSVDVNTLFEAGSVSKPVFALGVMKLKQDGKIDLDKDVNQYLKSWKVPANGDWQPVLTLRQLLSHTAGLTVHGFPGYQKSEKIPTVPEVLSGTGPANTPAVKVNMLPGTGFRYSGGGTTVAMLTVADLLGKPFPTIMRETVFDPLKLTYSTYEQPLPAEKDAMASTAYPWKGNPIPGRYHVYPEMSAAGLWTNPTELATLAIEVQKALEGKSNFYKKETIEEMLTPQKVMQGIGIGFFLDGKGDSTRFGHNGWDEGFVANFIAYKKLGKGVVIMVNSNEGYDIMDEILRAVAKEYNWPDFQSKPLENSGAAGNDEACVGTYKNMDGTEMKIANENNKLQLYYQQQPAIPLVLSKDKFYYTPSMNFKIFFGKDELRFEQNGGTKVFKKG
jgi:CubicO group peptidase (beta-lactamase class C family)